MLKEKGEALNVGVTICRYDNYSEIEPNAPHPNQRIESLKKLYDYGIGCNVIIRPIFPDSHIDDLITIIDKTNKYCYGYLLESLYLNDNIRKYFERHKIDNDELLIEKKMPEWNQYLKIEVIHSPEIMQKLRNYIEENGNICFTSNELCVNEIRKSRRKDYD